MAPAAQDAATEENRVSLAATGVVRTMCPMNCHPTLCGMLADVRDGELIGVRGDPVNPDSRGFLCIRGQARSPWPAAARC